MKTILLTTLTLALSLSSFSQVKDIDGNEYKTVKIGEQEWMVENLNVTHFRNGDEIPQAKTAEEWKKAGEEKKPAWCYYNNDSTKSKLYNWYAVNDARGLAPDGMKVADKIEYDEWQILEKRFSLPDGERDWEGGFNSSLPDWWSSNDYDGIFAFRFQGGTSPQPDGRAVKCIVTK